MSFIIMYNYATFTDILQSFGLKMTLRYRLDTAIYQASAHKIYVHISKDIRMYFSFIYTLDLII